MNIHKKRYYSKYKKLNLKVAKKFCFEYKVGQCKDKADFVQYILGSQIYAYLGGIYFNHPQRFYYYFHQNSDFILWGDYDFTYDKFLSKYPLADENICKIIKVLDMYSKKDHSVEDWCDVYVILNYITETFLKTINISDFLINEVKEGFFCKNIDFQDIDFKIEGES